MKKNSYLIFLIICVILAAALLLTMIGLVSAKSEARAADEQVQILTQRVRALEEQNQVLQNQLEEAGSDQPPIYPVNPEDYYCTLMVDVWSVDHNVLTVSAFAQAALSENIQPTAQLELWRGDSVLKAVPVTLDVGEAVGMYEADIVNAAFEIPEIGADEELQLWLVVDPGNGDAIYSCGAGWYPENGQLMLITG